jgi:hypothetical protein
MGNAALVVSVFSMWSRLCAPVLVSSIMIGRSSFHRKQLCLDRAMKAIGSSYAWTERWKPQGDTLGSPLFEPFTGRSIQNVKLVKSKGLLMLNALNTCGTEGIPKLSTTWGVAIPFQAASIQAAILYLNTKGGYHLQSFRFPFNGATIHLGSTEIYS